MKKAILYFVTAFNLIFLAAPLSVSAMSPSSDQPALSDVERKPDIDWQYTVIDGVLYRRLFNYSTKTPLSDWEIVP